MRDNSKSLICVHVQYPREFDVQDLMGTLGCGWHYPWPLTWEP